MTKLVVLIAVIGCNKTADGVTVDAPERPSDARPDSPDVQQSNPLALSCAAPVTAAECPAPPGDDGHATFCFRPQWAGVTSVDVLGGFGKADDWTNPLVTLVDQGNGTWTATVALANGTYPYDFRVHGATDIAIGANGMYEIDQTNPAFVKPPAGSKYKRSVSLLTVPQPTVAIHHVHGNVVLTGLAQPCFVAQIDVGELRDMHGALISEHGTANFVEIGPDGTFDVPVADGGVLLDVKYPFALATSYPDPAATPSVGVARTSTTVAGADVTLAPAEVGFASYAAMSPSGAVTVPVPFAWSLGTDTADYMSITATNVAGNDPAYTTSMDTATTNSWDGKLNNGMQAPPGTYYWGTWQKRGDWTSESLLFPIQL